MRSGALAGSEQQPIKLKEFLLKIEMSHLKLVIVRTQQVHRIAQVVYNGKNQVSNSRGTCVTW